MFYVKKVKLNNFRCFLSTEYSFEPNINILIGNNGCGKTSIVEGISYLCLGKSFRNAKDKDVINFNSSYFNIISEIINGVSENKVIIGYDGVNKKVNYDNYVCKTLSEFVGKHKLVSFSPDDIEVIKGSPSKRRRFIDVFISQCDNRYLKILVEYKKILKIRNEYLKKTENSNFDKVYFDVLTESLIKYGQFVISIREKYIKLLNETVKYISKELSNDKEIVEIEYKPNCGVLDFEKATKRNYNVDKITKITNCGPQKDDISIKIANMEALLYASQGQSRLAVLGIKLGMYELFSKMDDNIIIILDDVFSELDIERQKYLLKYIKNTGQVFITATDVYKLPEELIKESNIIEIKEG